MAKSKKKRADKPTAQDYSHLIGRVDIALDLFRQLKMRIVNRWDLWCLTIYMRDSVYETQRRADKRWTDYVELARLGRSFWLGSDEVTFCGARELNSYHATTVTGDESQLEDIGSIMQAAIKGLLVFFRREYKVSDYLDNFVRNGGVYDAFGTSPLARHELWPWFEFVYSVGHDVPSFVTGDWFLLPCGITGSDVFDYPPEFYSGPTPPWEMGRPLIPPGISTMECPIDRCEPRIHPEGRCIRDICEASILALQFLRQKAEERLVLLGDGKQGGADLPSGGQTSEKPAAAAAEGTPSVTDTTGEMFDDALVSPAKLAEAFDVPLDALRKRLERLRRDDHNSFVENEGRKSTEAKYLYKIRAVRPIIEDMKTSSSTSSTRPAHK